MLAPGAGAKGVIVCCLPAAAADAKIVCQMHAAPLFLPSECVSGFIHRATWYIM